LRHQAQHLLGGLRGDRAVYILPLAHVAQVVVREHVAKVEKVLPHVPVAEVVQVLGPVAQLGQGRGLPGLDAFRELHQSINCFASFLSAAVRGISEVW